MVFVRGHECLPPCYMIYYFFSISFTTGSPVSPADISKVYVLPASEVKDTVFIPLSSPVPRKEISNVC